MRDYEYTTVFGGGTIRVSADTLNELFERASAVAEFPSSCPECGASVTMSYREPKGYKYYSLVCTGEVRHEATLGQRKENGALYYKAKEGFKAYGGGDFIDEAARDHSPSRADHERAGWGEKPKAEVSRDEAVQRLKDAIRAKGTTTLAAFLEAHRITDPKVLTVGRILELADEVARDEEDVPF